MADLSKLKRIVDNGSQNKVHESKISDDPATGTREFMDFMRKMLK